MAASPASKPVLYATARSSCSWRVRAVLTHKLIEFDMINPEKVNISDGQEATLQKLNPLSQVPVLIIDGHTLTQSVAIVEYLEETRPDHPLFPKEPLQRAQIRQIVEIVNSGMQPLNSPATASRASDDPKKQKEWQVYWIEKGLTALEKILTTCHGACCVGDQLTMADIFVVPQMHSAKRFGADLSKFPVCNQLFEELLKQETFQKSHPDRYT